MKAGRASGAGNRGFYIRTEQRGHSRPYWSAVHPNLYRIKPVAGKRPAIKVVGIDIVKVVLHR